VNLNSSPAFVFDRLFRQFANADDESQAKSALQLLNGPDEAAYISFLQNNGAEEPLGIC
jgi:hypothetical protein